MRKASSCGLILASLMLLAGCSAHKTEIPIPPQLLAPCNEPQWDGLTNGDLVEYVGELKEALGRCNADKEAIKSLIEN